MGLREWWNSFKAQPEAQIEMSSGIYVQQEGPNITRARRAATTHAQAGDYVAAVSDLERVRELEIADGSEPDCISEIRRDADAALAPALQFGARAMVTGRSLEKVSSSLAL